MRKLENEGMRELENERIGKWGARLYLEEWGCASEIKQNLNKIKATPCKPAEGLLVYSTLPKVRAAQAVVARWAINFAKVWDKKAMCWGLLGGFGRKRNFSEESWEGFWWKKAIGRVRVAYRELIGSLYESWTIGIERVCKKLINNIIQQG